MAEDIKGQITKRELEVLELLSRGFSSIEIAEDLFISKNIAELIGKAYREGILLK